MSFLRRVRYWVNRQRQEADLAEEIEAHRMMVEANLAREGVTPAEAAQTSRRTLGNVLLAREDARGVWIWPWLEAAWQDLRYAARLLRRQPAFASVVITMLALGIGTSTVVFSVVNGILLRPIAAERPDDLARVVFARQDSPEMYGDLSWPNYADLRDRNASFSGLAGHALTWVAIGTTGTPDVVFGELVTGNYFDILRIKPILGRGFSEDEGHVPGGSPVVVLSYSLWQRMFGASPTLPGRTVRLNGQVFTVIGIAPEGFTGTKFPMAVDFWTPISMRIVLTGDQTWTTARGQGLLAATGRLKPGVTLGQAQSDIDRIARNLATIHPDSNQGTTARVVTEVEGRLGEGYRPATLFALLALALAGLVLLITCANVANLLLGRALVRTREMGIRMSLGAGRGRVLRQLFTESTLFACLGGLAGMLVTYAGTDFVRALIPPAPPAVQDIEFVPDGRVFAWAMTVSVIAGFIFALVPALRAARTDLVSVTKTDASIGGRRWPGSWVRLRASDLLVATQICVSVVVLVCAGLFVRSLRNAQAVDPGFQSDRLVSMMISPGLLQYTATEAKGFYRELERRVVLLPHVSAASVSGGLLLVTGPRSAGPVVRAGDAPPPPNQGMSTSYLSVGPGYFDAAGTSLTRGRHFTEHDDDDAPPVAIVNQEFAKRVFGNEDAALRRRFRLGAPTSPMLQIVGIVRDGKYESLYESRQPVVFLPQLQRTEMADLSTGFLLARADAADLRALAEAMRDEVQKLDPRVPVTTVRTEEDHLSVALVGLRIGTAIASAFGLLAFVLATTGVYAVMSHAVSRRTREMGIRMAIGARPRDVMRLTIKHGMTVVLVAMVFGLILTLSATRLLRGALLGVSPTDLTTIVAIAMTLASAALVACYLPARRAARVDPVVALRSE
jgi:predicted permease